MSAYVSLLSTIIACVAKRSWTLLANAIELLAISPADTYRPEAHYMRGPGPKWREKHAQSGRR